MEEQPKKRSIFAKILLFAGILGFPAFFILFFAMGKQNFEKLRYLGPHTVVNGDTVYYQVPFLSMQQYNGKTLTTHDLKGKIVVANFLSFNCPNDCPIDFFGFERFVADEICNNSGFEDVLIISSFIDTAVTMQNVADFIEFHEIDTAQWKFVQNGLEKIYDVQLPKQNPWTTADTIYGLEKVAYSMAILMDRDKHIRSNYNIYNRFENKRVTKEISILLREEKELANAQN